MDENWSLEGVKGVSKNMCVCVCVYKKKRERVNLRRVRSFKNLVEQFFKRKMYFREYRLKHFKLIK